MYYLEDKEFGKVLINVRSNMRNITMRWRGGSLMMNVPQGASKVDLQRALDEFRPKLSQTPTVKSLRAYLLELISMITTPNYGFLKL